MVGYVREVMVERRRWIEAKDFAEGLALCQFIPGATLTQVVSYVGLVLRGPAGAALAAASFVAPGAILVLILSALYFRWQTLPAVQSLSHGIAAVVVAILAYASLRLGRTTLTGWGSAAIAAAACLAFLGIGAVAFGGGYSMIPLVQQQAVDSLGLVSTQVFMDGIALGQVTPGPIMLTATFLGYAGWGVAGGLLATLAIFFPSWVILVLTAPRFHRWSNRATARAAIHGIVASFIGMLLSLLVRFGALALTTPFGVGLAVGAFVGLLAGVSLPLVILAGLGLSLVLF
jgi:chromate transporter